MNTLQIILSVFASLVCLAIFASWVKCAIILVTNAKKSN